MKTIILFFIGFLLIDATVTAQIPVYHGDANEIQKRIPDNLDVSRVHYNFSVETPETPKKFHPDRYGIVDSTSLRASNPGDESNWVVRLESPNALSIDLVLTDVNFSRGSKVYIFNEDKTNVLGPINWDKERNPLNILSTSSFDGNTVYIKVIEDGKRESSFTISSVIHGFRRLGSAIETESPNGRVNAISSVSCIPDATCYPSWSNQWEMIGRISVSGANGTGTFLNNEAQDRKPFFLTAFHVLDANDDNSLSTAEKNAVNTCVVLIDFRNVTCDGSVNVGALLTGGNFRAAWKSTDFALIEMFNIPDISNQVNYAGWSRSGSTPSQGFTLHHPDSQNMRYSASASSGVRVFPLNWNYLEVFNWGVGLTAPGSSGGPLFNSSFQVVGQLAGGLSSCSFTIGNDIYGRFYDSWDGGGTSDTQLKHWLSPVNNYSTIGGHFPLRFAPASNIICYGSNVTLTLPHVLPTETAASFSVSGNISIVSSTYNSVTVTASYPSGYGMATITATFGSVQAQTNVWYGPPNVYTAYYDSGIPASTLNYVSAGSHIAYLELTDIIAGALTGNVAWNPSPSIGFGYDQYFHKYDFTLSSGQTLYLNPVSATNACGTSNRTLVFAVPSGLLVYPNPATEYLTIQFENTSDLILLPKEIKLLSDKSTIPIQTISIDEVFNNQRFTDGNKIVMDVSELPKGIYYLHIVHRDKKIDTEKRRILIE